jgi:hypothetical protein
MAMQLLKPHQFGQHFGAAHHRKARARAAISSGLSRLIAVEMTTRPRPSRFSALWPTLTLMPLSRSR